MDVLLLRLFAIALGTFVAVLFFTRLIPWLVEQLVRKIELKLAGIIKKKRKGQQAEPSTA